MNATQLADVSKYVSEHVKRIFTRFFAFALWLCVVGVVPDTVTNYLVIVLIIKCAMPPLLLGFAVAAVAAVSVVIVLTPPQ